MSSNAVTVSGQELPDREAILDLIAGRTLVDVESSEEAQFAIARQILEATTLDDAVRPRTSIATRDVVGKPFEMRSFRIRPGEIEGRKGNYVLIEAVDLDSGELVTLNTSAPNVIAVLYRAAMDDALPIRVTVEHAQAAKAGRSAPLTLKPHSPNGEAWHHLKDRDRKAA